MKTILFTLLVSAVLALILGILLGFFKKIFHVEVDETVEKIRACLPGANCGGCGYPGCDGFASACAKGEAPANGCVAGGASVASKVGEVLGVTAEVTPKVAFVGCRGTKDVALTRGNYIGVKSCKAAKQAINGTKLCAWACIGYGDCVEACSFNAIKLGDDGIPVINYDVCTGCGSCSRACPQKIIKINNKDLHGVLVQCSNKNPVKAQVLKFCKNGCIKCGKCEKACESDAIHLVDNIPVVDYAKCTACGKCAEGCPTKVLRLA